MCVSNNNNKSKYKRNSYICNYLLSLCSNKKEELYYLILSEINKNINYNNDGIFKPCKIHIDFEIGLSNAIIRVWNESQI